MKVLIITNNLFTLHKFRRELIQKMALNNSIHIISPIDEYEADFVKTGCVIHKNVINRRSINVINEFKLLIQYYKLIKHIKPEKIITYSIKPNIYGGFIARLLHIELHVNVQGLGSAFQNRFSSVFVKRMYKIAIKRATSVFFENQSNLSSFLDWSLSSIHNSFVLPGAGVNISEYFYAPPKISNQYIFLYNSRIMKEKGIEELLDAFEIVKKRNSNAILRIAGWCEEAYEERLINMNNSNIIEYLGFVKDIKEEIYKCHCVILPSWHEGLSNSLLEAASCGRMLITTNIPGCREVVINNKTGYVIEKKNTEQIIDALERTIKLNHEDITLMGLEGRKHIEKIYEKSKVVDLTLHYIFKENRDEL